MAKLNTDLSDIELRKGLTFTRFPEVRKKKKQWGPSVTTKFTLGNIRRGLGVVGYLEAVWEIKARGSGCKAKLDYMATHQKLR